MKGSTKALGEPVAEKGILYYTVKKPEFPWPASTFFSYSSS